MKTLRASWIKFAAAVIPKNATSAEIEMARLCFYGGAAGLLSMTGGMDNDKVLDTDPTGSLREAHAELLQFAADTVTTTTSRK